jgi:chemotaxis family two-component system sensor kinase Cph1
MLQQTPEPDRFDSQILEPTNFDFSGCDQEPLCLPGAIQSHGVLLALEPPGMIVRQVSENCADLLGVPPEQLLGKPVETLCPEGEREALCRSLAAAMDKGPTAPLGEQMRVPIRMPQKVADFDGSAHWRGDGVILELENPVDPSARPLIDEDYLIDRFRLVSEAEARMRDASIEEMAAILAAETRRFSGFDRAMVYRFVEDGDGEVIAEDKIDGIESYLGLRYPASHIPKQARQLYALNWVRLIPDARRPPARLVSRDNPFYNEPLDLSRAILRPVAPVPIEHLLPMGAAASLAISLLRQNHLWGLIICHHRTPRFLSRAERSACELLGNAMSLQLSSQAVLEDAREKTRAQELQFKLLTFAASRPSLLDVADAGASLPELVRAQGAAVVSGGHIRARGLTPSVQQIAALADWLRTRVDLPEVFSTDRLSKLWPSAAEFACDASGLLSAAIARRRGDFIFFFRPEWVREFPWACKPHSIFAGAPTEAAPRLAFRETIRGRSRPWMATEQAAARDLREALLDHIIQRADDLARLNAELRETNKELDSFAYSVSHDLKEPLRGIGGYARRFANPSNPAETALHAQAIIRLVERMEGLVDSMLRLARASRRESRLEKADLNEPLAEALDTLSPRQAELRAEIVVPRPLPVVLCDRISVREILINLISNSLKYNDSERPRVEIGWTEPAAQGEPPVFHVRDNGIGIPEAYRERVFEVFQRLHGPERYGGGSGAGLAIARKLAERHGGRLRVEGAPGGGSLFLFTLAPRSGSNLAGGDG